MKAKEYLRRLRRLDSVINQKLRELSELKAMSISAGGLDYSKERVQTSPSGDAPFLKIINKMIDLEAEINNEIDAFIAEKRKIINQIQSLKNADYVGLLYKRYIEYKSLDQICDEMSFSYDYIKHLHGYALRDFEKRVLNSTPNNTK